MATESRQNGGSAWTPVRPTVNGSFPETPCAAILARLPLPFPRAYRLLDADLAALLGVEGRVLRLALRRHDAGEPFHLFFEAAHTAWALGAMRGEWDEALLAPGHVIPQPAWMRRFLDRLLDELADDDLGPD